MTTALIADDEPLLRDELRDVLRELWPDLNIIDSVGDGLSALQAIKSQQPDIAFLDIKMPRMTGLEVAEQLDGNDKTQVVFVTAFDDHAIAAFDQGAVDYVMKPIRLARIAKTIERLQKRAEADEELTTTTANAARAVARALGRESNVHLKFIQASVGKQLRFIMVEEILFMQSDHKYTRVVTAQTEAFIRKPLTDLESELDPDLFWRVHRGTLVNIRAIDVVVREEIDRMSIKLKGSAEKLEVSRAHQSQFKGV
jgi:DNA-binding LytR/AlgR family response regulator